MSATANKKIALIIEDNPEADGRTGKIRQLEYDCVITTVDGLPHLDVKAVRDANSRELITDSADLPPIDVVLEAVQLYGWSWINRRVYSPGIPQVDGVNFKARPGRGKRGGV